jgi:hypothetical protein
MQVFKCLIHEINEKCRFLSVLCLLATMGPQFYILIQAIIRKCRFLSV